MIVKIPDLSMQVPAFPFSPFETHTVSILYIQWYQRNKHVLKFNTSTAPLELYVSRQARVYFDNNVHFSVKFNYKRYRAN